MDSHRPERLLFHHQIVVHPENANIVYVAATGSPYDNKPERGIFKTTNGGKTWKKTLGLTDDEKHVSGADVHLHPTDYNTLYASMWDRDGGEASGMQGTDDGGKTWRHAIIPWGNDHQDLWIDPMNSDHMIGSSDSGIRISFNGCKTWYHPDNLPGGQFFTVSIDRDFPYHVYGGMQDFGTWKGPSTKRGRFPIRFEDWQHVRGADVQVDPSDSRWLYVESQYGDITINDQKTSVRKNIQYRKEGIRYNYIAPILISPHNSNVIYHGANMLLRSSFRGEDWQEISPDLTNQRPCAEKGEVWGTITSIDESPIRQGVIWAGTDDGNVQLTQDNGETWTAGVTVQIYRGSHLVNEYAGSGEPGLNSVELYLTERIPRTDKEKEEVAQWIENTRNAELYFDCYDGHDHFGEPDDEVSVTGRPLRIWIQTQPEWREVDYKHIRVRPGEYVVKLIVNGSDYSTKARVLKDQWFDEID